jgi:hypothetical protein
MHILQYSHCLGRRSLIGASRSKCLLVAVQERSVLAAHLDRSFRAFPSWLMVSERSSPSRVRFAAPNNGAPLTAPGRSEQTLPPRGKGSKRKCWSTPPPKLPHLSIKDSVICSQCLCPSQASTRRTWIILSAPRVSSFVGHRAHKVNPGPEFSEEASREGYPTCRSGGVPAAPPL